jgi:hypothetical protein
MSTGFLMMLADWHSCKWGYARGEYGRACCSSDGLIHFVIDTPPFRKVWIKKEEFREGPR